MKPTYYECGICNMMHSAEWDGDCRERGAGLFVQELDTLHGPFGWAEIQMDEIDEWRAAQDVPIHNYGDGTTTEKD